MKKIVSYLVALVFAISSVPVVQAADAENNSDMSYVSNMFGRSNALEYGEAPGIGWENVSVDWAAAEDTSGKIDADYILSVHNTLNAIKSSGKKAMLTIENVPMWAVDKSEFTFDRDEGRYKLGEYIGIKYGKMVRNLTYPDGNVEEITVGTEQMPVSKRYQYAWTSFVEKIAKEFKADGVVYVQIGNNPFGSAKEYFSGADEYFTGMHKPAADILHRYGYKVVCGGVSTGFGVTRILDLLDRQNGYDTIDVFNLTYNTLGAVNYMYNELTKKGKENPSIWLTAVGYENSGVYTPNLYPRFLRWSIDVRDTSNPDQFKIFWSEKAQNGKEIPLCSNGELTIYGKEIAAIANLLDGKTLNKFDRFEYGAQLNFHIFDNMSSAEGFKTEDGRVVLAAHFLKQNTAAIFSNDSGDTMHVNFSNSYTGIKISDIPRNSIVKRTTVTGNQWEINREWNDDGTVYTEVAVPDKISAPAGNINETAEAVAANSGFMTSFYVEIVPPSENAD